MCNHARWFKVKQSKQLLQYDFLKQEFINNSNIKSDKFNFRLKRSNKRKIVDYKKIFAGFHTNKKNWVMIKLDESIELKKKQFIKIHIFI